jgi:hypothetical protein
MSGELELKTPVVVIAPPEESEILPVFARKTKIATHFSGLLVYVFDPGSNVHCGMTLTKNLVI